MEKIPSFTINHLTLMPGIYVSRRDVTDHGDVLTTFDIRMTAPNRQPALSPEVQHTIEHLAATFLRNHPDWKDKVVYWGPMGCCTGSYLIMEGDIASREIVDLMRQMFQFISEYEGEIPGATPRDCGNYSYMDLSGAKSAARKFIAETLMSITPERLEYPD